MTISESWSPKEERSEKSLLLRRALLVNATFSILNGAVIGLVGSTLLPQLGIPEIVPAPLSGLMLILFGLLTGWSATRVAMPTTLIWLIVGLDAAWVVGSVVIIGLLSLPPMGNIAVLVTALVVLIFALTQTAGLRRLQWGFAGVRCRQVLAAAASARPRVAISVASSAGMKASMRSS